MKPATLSLLSLLALASVHAQEVQIDWQRAQTLHRRVNQGEKLSAEDQKYYEVALKQFQARQRNNPGTPRTEEVHDFKPSEASKGLVPLTELTGKYRDWDGGLYGGGSNEVPAAQQARATKALAQIRPLDVEGKPSASGKIVLMSIGMSNTTQEFSTFVRGANNAPRKADNVVVVDGAQGGQTAMRWATADGPWDVAAQRLETAGVSPKQIQVLWVKQANAGPTGSSENEVTRLQNDVQTLVTRAREKYPNVQIVFLSSRIYAGYAQTRLNPEPYAYEGAFAMRGLIQKQIKGDAPLAEGKFPTLLWGPYLWGAGPTPRKADNLVWKPEDLSGDGTHPSHLGAQKVAALLLEFFTHDANSVPWFVKKG